MHEVTIAVTISIPPMHRRNTANVGGKIAVVGGTTGASATIVKNRIRATWAYAAYQELKRRRCEASLALEEAGLTELSVLDKERWIPFDKEVMFLEAAAEVSGDDCFGLHLAPTIDLRTTGLIAYVGLAARTLDDAIRNFIHYQRVHNLAMRGELIDDGARVRMRIDYLQPELHRYKQRQEMGAGIHVHVARWLTQKDISPVEVRFKHARNQNRDEVERVLGCPVRFGRRAYETIFHRDQLSLPLPTADSELLKVLTKNADQVL